VVVVVTTLAIVACGKRGPPLPPLVKLPVAPTELSAERHGPTVDLQLTVPAANTDGTRPANVARVDVYGITGPAALTDDQIVKLGTLVASVPVKAPRDPNQTIDPDEPESTIEAPEGKGLDQGARARVAERLTPEVDTPVDLSKATTRKRSETALPAGPLLPPPLSVPSRTYVGVGVSAKGRRGPLSQRVSVALTKPPAAPAAPDVDYNEQAITVAWTPAGVAEPTPPPGGDEVLPSAPIGVTPRTLGYNVYQVSDAEPPGMTRLTKAAVSETHFSDQRIAWGERRCYVVRAVETIADASVEGDESAPACVTLTDTFPPAAPKGLQAVSTEGAINLIWDANTEKDVRGYIVLRGVAAAATLEAIVMEPIQETSFKDGVQPGVRYAYAVQAVDSAGNVSPMSARVEETAR